MDPAQTNTNLTSPATAQNPPQGGANLQKPQGVSNQPQTTAVQQPSPAQQAANGVGAKPDYTKPYQAGQVPSAVPQTQGQKTALSLLDQQNLEDILVGIGQLLLSMQIYKADHPTVKKKITDLALKIIKTAQTSGRLILSNREDLIFLNGYQEKVSGGPLQKLVDTLKFLKVASFEIEKGITEQEVTLFFSLLAAQRRAQVTGDIKGQLQKAGISHIRPIFLQYVEVNDLAKDVPEPKNVIEGTKQGYKKSDYTVEEQMIGDFLKGKIATLPKRVNTFLLNHPKLAALVLIKLLDEYQIQNLDSFSAFQTYVKSLSHYMARLSRVVGNPDKVAQALERLEKHLNIGLRSLEKDKKFITTARQEIKDANSWVQIEQILSHYEEAKKNLSAQEQEIIDAIEKRKVPSIPDLRQRLNELGLFQSKLSAYFQASRPAVDLPAGKAGKTSETPTSVGEDVI